MPCIITAVDNNCLVLRNAQRKMHDIYLQGDVVVVMDVVVHA